MRGGAPRTDGEQLAELVERDELPALIVRLESGEDHLELRVRGGDRGQEVIEARAQLAQQSLKGAARRAPGLRVGRGAFLEALERLLLSRRLRRWGAPRRLAGAATRRRAGRAARRGSHCKGRRARAASGGARRCRGFTIRHGWLLAFAVGRVGRGARFTGSRPGKERGGQGDRAACQQEACRMQADGRPAAHLLG